MENTCFNITYPRQDIIFVTEFKKMGKKLHLVRYDNGARENDQYLIIDTKTRAKAFITVSLFRFISAKY